MRSDITRIAIVDVSGSMNEPFHAEMEQGRLARRSSALVKFGAALEYVRFAVEKMPRDSHVVIIAFAEAATVVYDGAVGDSAAIDRALGFLRPDGRATNLGAAFELVLELIASGEHRVRPVDIVTDGLSNAGEPISSAKTLRERHGVYIHLYLIDPTDEGQAIASAIVGQHGEGEVDPVGSAATLRERQQQSLEVEHRQLLDLEEIRAERSAARTAFLNRARGRERPRITAAYPQSVLAQEWNTIEVFVYLRSLEELVRKEIGDLERRMMRAVGAVGSEFPRSIPMGCPVTVRLSSPAVLLNPTELTIRWYEPYNRLPFRFASRDDVSSGTSVSLHIDVSADELPVAEIGISVAVLDPDDRTAGRLRSSVSSSPKWLDTVFASYAREDGEAVRQLQARYEALGVDLLVDVERLRAGAIWRPELFKQIDQSM